MNFIAPSSLLHALLSVRTGRAVAVPPAEISPLAMRCHQVLTFHRHPGGRFIKVLEGSIWLTETPAGKDILLQAKEEFRLGDNYPVVVEALTDAKIILIS